MDYLAPLLIVGIVFLLMRGMSGGGMGGGCCGGHGHGHGGHGAKPIDQLPEARK